MTAVATSQFDPKAHRAFLKQLRTDLGDAARKLDRNEARYLVDLYYQLQEFRKASANQSRAAGEDAEPNAFVSWIQAEFLALESEIKRAMKEFAAETVVGNWTMNLHGFGPVIAGGLIAHIDIEKAPTAGHIWSFAGLNPSVIWGGREGAKKAVEEVLGAKSSGEKIGFDEVAKVAAHVGRNAASLYRMAKAKTDVDEDTDVEHVTFAGLVAAMLSEEGLKGKDAKKRINDALGLSRTKGDYPLDLEAVRLVVKGLDASAEDLFLAAQHADEEADQYVTRAKLTSALAKRPWNAKLKVLIWKIGQCVIKFQNGEKSYYGPLFRDYKGKLIAKNQSGGFTEAAAKNLAMLKDKTTVTYKANSEGRLSDGHINDRAARWVGKLFISHWHEVAYREHFDELARKPFVLASELHPGHTHWIEVPAWPFPGDYQKLVAARLPN